MSISELITSFYFEMFFIGICAGIFIGGFGLAIKSVIHIFKTTSKIE